jgi:hypothetical protein
MRPHRYDAYALAELGQAMDTLEGEGHVRERLHRAWMYGLHVVRPDNLSDDSLREGFEQLRAIFYRETPKKVPGEGRVDALWEMSDLEAELLAVRIELLYEQTKERID